LHLVPALLKKFSENQTVTLFGFFLSAKETEWARDFLQPFGQEVAGGVYQASITLLPVRQLSERIPEFQKREIVDALAGQKSLDSLLG
jgi:hypothetical protein